MIDSFWGFVYSCISYVNFITNCFFLIMELNFDEVLIADLHIHSRFSRACSKNITFENLVKWARIKGLNLLGTGDFTHPTWINEISEKLKDNGEEEFIWFCWFLQ